MPEKDPLFAIYQLKQGDEYAEYKFMPLDRLEKMGRTPDPAHYQHIYTAALPDVRQDLTLNHIYHQFNFEHPADYAGWSLSVSDVVVIRRGGNETAYFTDGVGFRTLTDFVQGLDVPAHLPEHDPAIQPVVTILWSEDERFTEGQRLPIHKADRLFAELDSKQRAEREQPGHTGPWYNKTQFMIDFVQGNEHHTYEGRQDFGDGDGGLIDHIYAHAESYRHNEQWQNRFASEGPEKLAETNAGYDYVLESFAPYLRLHCDLAEMRQSAVEGIEELRRGREPTAANLHRAAFYRANLHFVDACRKALNSGEDLPDTLKQPKLEDFMRDPETKAYEGKVLAELRQEAADAGMTLDEYAANGYEPRQAENPLLAAELSTEQNYNQIDGVINNLPPDPPASLADRLQEKKQVAAEQASQPEEGHRQKKPPQRERE